MTALMFGEAERPLFGKFHHAAAARTPVAAVICPPIGEEGVRAFRPLKVLGDQLAASGVPTLRFDWYGTGDSSGDEAGLSQSSMADSLMYAHEEVGDMTGARKILWIGLRLGATVAGMAANLKPRGLSGLILWDPVTDVQQYFDDQQQAHAQLIEDSTGTKPMPGEALGFSWPQSLISSFVGLESGVLGKTVKNRLWIGEGAPSGFPSRIDPDDGIWDSDKALNAYVVPGRTLSMIVEEVARWQRPNA